MFILGVSAQLTGYPTLDAIAPVNAEWSNAFLSRPGVVIPNVPINDKQLTVVDWSQDISRCNNLNDWGLTYDDGPGLYTMTVLDQLKARNVKATFFVTGSRVVERPSVVKAIYDQGHLIGIHTWSHRALTTLANDQIVAETVYTANAIREAIGFTPLYFRPPFGDIDPRVRAVLKSMGMTIVVWNKDTIDTNPTVNVTATAQLWMSQPANASISLQHDLFNFTAPNIAPVADIVLKGGFTPKRIDDCLGRTDAYTTKTIFDNVAVSVANPSGTSSTPKTTSTFAAKSGASFVDATLALLSGLLFL
ncbi:hypothetical protein EDD86DRAFT_234889 [Gorgonomyces haynaldii]|nr:hypothetical protein EDD86DRAFT_234889 [Gorgonomyces haynaldii]